MKNKPDLVKSCNNVIKERLKRDDDRKNNTINVYALKHKNGKFSFPFVGYNDLHALEALSHFTNDGYTEVYKICDFCILDGKAHLLPLNPVKG